MYSMLNLKYALQPNPAPIKQDQVAEIVIRNALFLMVTCLYFRLPYFC